jgi:two-component system, LytTR family, response regulator
MKLRTVIADDEPLARERLKLMLSEEPEIDVVAECRNGAETVRHLQSQPSDLLLLDVQMPGAGGFDVIASVGVSRMPPTVFVTAHPDFAIQAFTVQAIDYLTKPIDPVRLHETLVRVRRRIAENTALLAQDRFNEAIAALRGAIVERSYQERFIVRDGTKDVLVPVGEIEWIEAADYYSCLHVGPRSYMLRESIKQLGTLLDPSRFVRIHRSVMVRIDQIREIHRDGENEYFVVLTGGQRLRMSRTGWKNLIAVNRSC